MYRSMARTILYLAVPVLASLTAMAASKNGVTTGENGRRTIASKPASQPFTPYVDSDAGLNTIFNNLGSAYPLGAYWCCSGGTISGPLSEIETAFWEAAGFIPGSDGSITRIKVALGYVSGAAKDVILTLHEDAGGVPGAVLRRWKVTDMPAFRSCCEVSTKKDRVGIPVTGGKLYWVAVSTEPTSDIWVSWNLNDTDQVNAIPSAFAQDGVWTSRVGGSHGFAFAVFGP